MIDTDTGAVEAHGIGGQAVHPYPALQHGVVKARLGRFVTQHAQDIGEAIIGAIGVAQSAPLKRRSYPTAWPDARG